MTLRLHVESSVATILHLQQLRVSAALAARSAPGGTAHPQLCQQVSVVSGP